MTKNHTLDELLVSLSVYTPARTLSISLEITIFDLKMMVKSGLEFFISTYWKSSNWCTLKLWNCKTVCNNTCTATGWNPFWYSWFYVSAISRDSSFNKNSLWSIWIFRKYFKENLNIKRPLKKILSPMVIGFKPTNTYRV